MAIKSTVNEPKADEISFPCLMWNKYSGLVVLFSSVNAGTVLRQGDGGNDTQIGTYSDNWTDCMDKGIWEPIQAITLEMV